MNPKFVIASTGRSGSQYIAKVLTEAGISTGHEKYFTNPYKNKKTGYIGESSCFSVPHLQDYDGIVIHQVRNPLHVFTSLIENHDKIVSATKIWNYRKSFMPYKTGEIFKDYMLMIWNMNEIISESAIAMYRVEDVDEVALDIFMDIALGEDGSREEEIKKALSKVSKKTNKHHNATYLTWDDIPDSKEKELLMMQSDRYGY